MPPEEPVSRLQHVLTAYVKGHGVAQTVLARRSGLTEKHVSQMLSGRAAGTMGSWDALIEAAEAGPEPSGDGRRTRWRSEAADEDV
jgi:transcriptional regulator with XRE-family HTH domain